MADIRNKLTIDGLAEAKQGLDDTAVAAGNLGTDLDGTRSKGQQVAAALDAATGQIEQSLRQAAAAAAALGSAMGPELASRVNVNTIVSDFKNLGLTVEDIIADADSLAGSVRRLNDVQASELGQRLKDVGTEVDGVGKSADSSKGALANMVGNSAQDLGNLAGIAGSAGVAFGQMGEYMADARLEGEGLGSVLRSFGSVALPIAGLAVLTGLLGDITSQGQAMQKALDDAAKSLNAAVLEAQGTGETVEEIFAKVGADKLKSDLEGLGAATGAVITGLQNQRLSLDSVREAYVSGQGPLVDALTEYDKIATLLAQTAQGKRDEGERWRFIGDSMGISADAAHALYDNLRPVADALGTSIAAQSQAAGAAGQLALFAGQASDAQLALAASSDAARLSVGQTATAIDTARTAAENLGRTAPEVAVLKDTIGELGDKADESQRKTTAFSDALNALFGGPGGSEEQKARAFAAALDKVTASFAKNGKAATDGSDAGRQNLDALDDGVQAIKDYAQASLRNGASQEDVTRSINGNISALVDQAVAAGGSREEIEAYINTLGLTPDKVETTIKVADDDVAKQKLQDYKDQLDSLPPAKAVQIQTLIDEGSFQQAANDLQTWADNHVVQLQIQAGRGAGYGNPMGSTGGSGDPDYVGTAPATNIVHLTANINGAVSADVNWFAQVFLQAVRQGLIGTGSRVLYS